MKKIICLMLFLYLSGHSQSPAFQWAKAFQRTGNSGAGGGITVDGNGNVYVTGAHDGLNFNTGGGPGGYWPTSGASSDGFIAKLDNAGNHIWSGTIGGPGVDGGNSIFTDGNGDVYTCGTFNGTADLDPTLGTYALTANGTDSYIVKMSSSGTFLWGIAISGSLDQVATNIRTDSGNNLYIAGYFTGTADFDPGIGTQTITSSGSDDIFVLKLSPTGMFQWVNTMGAAGNDQGLGLAIDNSDNVLVSGAFNGTVDFDPGMGISNAVSNGGNDIFVCKMNSAGVFQWVYTTGSSAGDQANSVSCDATGHVAVCGIFQGSLAVGATTLTNSGNADIFIMRLTTTGALSWFDKIGGTGTEHAMSIQTDGSGNVYTTGYFNALLDFDPGIGTYTLAPIGGSSHDIYINKLDSSGAYVWAGRMGNGNTIEMGNAIFVDPSRNIYSTGRFIGNVDFDPSPASSILSPVSTNYNYPYIHKMCQAPDRPPVISGSTLVCPATSGTYTIAAVPTATAYSWTLPPSWNGNSTLTSINSTVNATGNITVTAANACGTSASRTLNVQVSPNPVITVPSGSICPGATYTLVPAGAASYTYSSGSAAVSPAVTSSYTVVGTSSAGCISTTAATATVFLLASPVITANSGTVCAGNSFTLTPSGAASYTYSSGSNIVSPSATSSYSITGTSNMGCLSMSPAVATVTVLSISLPVITAGSGELCLGESFTINPSGALSYTISGGSFVVSPGSTTSYSITGTSAAGCISAAAAVVVVTVNPLPVLTLTTTNSSMCVGDELAFIAMGATTYTWNTTQVGPTLTIIATPVIQLTVTGTDDHGCNSSISISQTAFECTGLGENQQSGISFYPNPCHDHFILSGPLHGVVRITNPLGQLVYAESVNSDRVIIDSSTWLKGIYVVSIETENKLRRMKLVRD